MFYNLVLSVTLVVIVTSDITSAMVVEIHVSARTGSDFRGCGNPGSTPCASLAWAVSNAGTYRTVKVSGNKNDIPYEFNQDTQEDAFDKCLHIEGIGGPVLSAERSFRPGKTMSQMSKRCPHRWSDLVIADGAFILPEKLQLHSSRLYFTRISFRNAYLQTTGDCQSINLVIDNSTWQGFPDTPENQIQCESASLTITNSGFFQTKFDIEIDGNGTHVFDINVDNTLFSSSDEYVRRLGGIKLKAGTKERGQVAIRNSVFQKQCHSSRVNSSTNLIEASVVIIHSGNIEGQVTGDVKVILDNVTFEDNERALVAAGSFKEFLVWRSSFHHNIAVHAGSAVLSLLNKDTTLTISRCEFSNNTAGEFGNHYRVDESGEVTILGGFVEVDSACCHGRIPLVGKGGAIRLQRGKLIVNSSLFVNNYARTNGDVISVDRDASLQVAMCSFLQHPTHLPAVASGNVIFSRGNTNLSDINIDVKYLKGSAAVVDHDGDHWSIDVARLKLTCPQNYDLRIANASSIGISREGIQQSYLLDQLEYRCQECPVGTHSEERGSLEYYLQHDHFAWYIFKNDGSYPDNDLSGTYFHAQVHCEPETEELED